MKRIISCLLAVLLLVSISYQTPVIAAENEPAFTVSYEKADPGEKVSVVISMINNPGIASAKLKVQFDSDLILSTVTYNTELGGKSQQPQTFGSPVTLNWFNGGGNAEGDMTYAVLDFTVAENAALGDHAVTITYDPDDVYNIAEKNLPFNIVNGGVNVVISVKALALDHTAATVKTGDATYTLTPVYTPSNATNQNVTWKSSDTSVAAVEDGIVTLIKKGEAVITATSEDGGFEATCALTVLCSHLDTEVIPAVESTCILQGHEEYTICRECGEVIAGSDALLPYGDHKFVENAQQEYLKTVATCVSPAVYYKSCSVCGVKGTETFEHGEVDADNHVGGTHLENQADTSCKNAGYTGDVVCDSCGEIITKGSVIEKLPHTPAAAVHENEVPAKCEENGSYDEVVYCSVCGEELSRDHKTIPAAGHTYGTPEWAWDGYDSASATFTCVKGDDEQVLTATITSEITKEPSAKEDGERAYTATVIFNGKTYTDVKTEPIHVSAIIGDVDGDGEVSILDATAIQRHLAKLPTVAFIDAAADTDGDDEISILDATAIQRWLAKLPSSDRINTVL